MRRPKNSILIGSIFILSTGANYRTPPISNQGGSWMWHPSNGGQPVSPQVHSRNNLPQCDGNNLDDLNYSVGNNDVQDINNS